MIEVFPMIPPSGRGFWLLLGVLVIILAALLGLFGFIAYSSRHVTFEVSAEGLRLKGDFYGRMIPASALVVDEARRIDLRQAPDYRPRRRTFGTGLPGYLAGWFRLRNKEKALLYVSDRTRVVYIPTRQDYSVLLSVAEPERFLRALARTAPNQ